ncbi:hypothetical protein B0H21DRAFT_685285 [Amylocystis lapponica]|nr:hypothetical protein B0H21DRAFT_685285 [Amylocystis lapponica]
MKSPYEWGDPPPTPGDRHYSRLLATTTADTAPQPNAIASSTRETSIRTPPSSPLSSLSTEQDDSDVDDLPMGPPRRRPTRPSPTSRRAFITSKGWSLDGLLDKGEKFRHINRVSALGPAEDVSRAIERHEQDGIPLIIEGWHKRKDWPADIFNIQWLLKNHGDDTLITRNMHTRGDKTISMTDFVDECREKSPYIAPDETERLYGKDADCPAEWRDWLCDAGALPSELLPNSQNDLLQHLPDSKNVESLMCYLGIGDTFTPCHKDLCASSGHNIMCYTEDGGSSFWFMTASSDAPLVSNYFKQELRQELDWETHIASVDELAKAPFDVYVAEQKTGDLVLVPSRSCHQVVNHGGLTVKMSWSRMTLEGLRTALHYELPIYQRVCRPELYRVKSVLYRSLLHYTSQLEEEVLRSDSSYPTLRQRSEDLTALVELFDEVLSEEYTRNRSMLTHVISSGAGWAADTKGSSGHIHLRLMPPRASSSQKGKGKDTETLQSENFACDFCGADIFQSFLECHECTPNDVTSIGDGLLICAACYVDGRTCRCGSMNAVQYRPFEDLLRTRNKAAKVLHQILKTDGTRKGKFKALTERFEFYFIGFEPI